MSTSQAAHADPHGHPAGIDPDNHHPHVLPLSMYFGVFGTLLVLTGVTVGISYVDLGNANLLIALAVATVKALCVALIFMHLLFDKKFNAIVFSSSLLFLAIFIGFTMSDTVFRGYDGRSSSDGPADVQNPFAGTRTQAAMKKLYEKPPAVPVKIQDQVVGPKTDVAIFEQTPQPSGDAVSVNVPSAATAPGALNRGGAPNLEEGHGHSPHGEAHAPHGEAPAHGE